MVYYVFLKEHNRHINIRSSKRCRMIVRAGRPGAYNLLTLLGTLLYFSSSLLADSGSNSISFAYRFLARLLRQVCSRVADSESNTARFKV